MSRVKVDITADKSGFESAVKGVEHSIEGLKEMVVGAFSVEAIAGIVEKTVEYADTIDKASLRMKMTTEETQALSIVAKEAGSSLETIEQAFRKIETARAKALGGDAKSVAAFKALGLDTATLSKSNNTLGIAGQLASAARNGSNDKDGVALGQLGLKKSAGDLTALGDSLQNFGEKVDELKSKGAIMEDKDIANIVRAKDELEIVGTTLMAQVAPWLSQLIEGLEEGWIIFQTVAQNTFTAIILMAQHTIDFIKGLSWKSIGDARQVAAGGIKGFFNSGGNFIGAVTGAFTAAETGGKNPVNDYIKNIVGDVSDSFKGTSSEIDIKLKEYADKIAAQLAARAKARENKPEAESKIIPVKGNMKLYSDELTKSGNLIGASFQGVGSVVTALDVAKQQKASLDKIAEISQTQTDLLTTIANNTEQDDSDTWP
jgi:hypothetical protein